MFQINSCKCAKQKEFEYNIYNEHKKIFNSLIKQLNKSLYFELPVEKPYLILYCRNGRFEYYASKWYKCRVCGCLWEIKYADNESSQGFVRKFTDGKHISTIERLTKNEDDESHITNKDISIQTNLCECHTKNETSIESMDDLKRIKSFFTTGVKNGIYKDIEVKIPIRKEVKKNSAMEHYANKWYKCQVCGCLWEVDYPDFPSQGFVRKFEDGIYKENYKIDNNKI